jgi:hypothetical protein
MAEIASRAVEAARAAYRARAAAPHRPAARYAPQRNQRAPRRQRSLRRRVVRSASRGDPPAPPGPRTSSSDVGRRSFRAQTGRLAM